MRVVLSPRALASLEAIRDSIAQFSTEAAGRFVDTMEDRLRQLEMFPLSGRVVPEYGVPLLREIVEPPYRIVYELFPDRVEVVIIRHGRESFQG